MLSPYYWEYSADMHLSPFAKELIKISEIKEIGKPRRKKRLATKADLVGIVGGAAAVPAAYLGGSMAVSKSPLNRPPPEVVLNKEQVKQLRKLSPTTDIPELKDLGTSQPTSMGQKRKAILNTGEYNQHKNYIIAHKEQGATRRGSILAHELGHAKLHTSKLGPAFRAGGALLGGLGFAGAGLAGVSTSEDSPLKRVGDVGQYGGIAMTAPRLADEAHASISGYNALKRTGVGEAALRAARKDLLRAGGTYAGTGAAIAATPFAIRRLRKAYDARQG